MKRPALDKVTISSLATSSLLVLMFTSASATAHHAAGLLYDVESDTTIEGVVARFELGNPHMRIYFDRTDVDDGDVEWMAEGGSRTILVRRGWTNDMFKAGDRIVLHGNPSRDERPIYHVNDIETADGREIRAEDSTSDTLLEDLRKRRR